MKFFVKDFCETVQYIVFIFGMQVNNDVLNHGIANQPFSDFRCGVPLFIVILVIYKYKNR